MHVEIHSCGQHFAFVHICYALSGGGGGGGRGGGSSFRIVV